MKKHLGLLTILVLGSACATPAGVGSMLPGGPTGPIGPISVGPTGPVGSPGGSYLTDDQIHDPVPETPPAVGGTYNDPVFGGEVRRMTTGLGASDIYAKNGWWNADGSLYLVHSNGNNGIEVIDPTSGATVRADLPFGNVVYDISFDPVDPDVYYYWSGASLRQFKISNGADTVVHTFSGTLQAMGGSIDWIDATGQYMVLNVAGNAEIYDKTNDIVYSGSIPANFGGGYIGITPDAKYVVAFANALVSYPIDHVNHTLGTSGTSAWSLCGDHADYLSASDGKDYAVTFNCYEIPAIYRVDMSIPQVMSNPPDYAKQEADNFKLLDTTWADSGHFSCISRGPWRDWCFVSLEATGTASYPYRNEVILFNVLTGEHRRYAHHYSVLGDYESTPRINTSWDGTKTAWSSNFGGSTPDLYTLELSNAP